MIFFFLHTGESPRDARRSQYFLLFPLSLCVFHFFSRHRNALFGVGTRGWGGETHTHTHKGNRCIGDARRSLIFYDCLKCSASHNFAFADSNSRCVLSWRLRTSRGSLSLSLPPCDFFRDSFELARGSRNPPHRFDCLSPPWSHYFFLLLFPVVFAVCILLK